MFLKKQTERFQEYLTRPVDNSTLVSFRILLGLLLVYQSMVILKPAQYLTPFHFTFPLFDALHLPYWGTEGMRLNFIVMTTSALAIAVGFCYRLACAGFFLTFGYFFLIEKAYYYNHYYLILLLTFLLFIIGGDHGISLDNVLNPRHKKPTVCFGNIFILRCQISLVYFFSGIARLTPDWLSGITAKNILATKPAFISLSNYFPAEWFINFITYASPIFDLSIGFILWHPRFRRPALLLAIIFHAATEWLFDIGIFPQLMLACLILFLDPDQPRKIPGKMLRPRLFQPPKKALPEWKFKFIFGFMTLYFLVQFLVPLRHFLYQGDVGWTMEGYRFSWRMLGVSVRTSPTKFFVNNSRLQENNDTPIPITDLNFEQYMDLSMNPDMILQYAHHLKEIYRSDETPEPIVTVDAKMALNGRGLTPLIDPKANLATENYTPFTHAKWILPHPDKY